MSSLVSTWIQFGIELVDGVVQLQRVGAEDRRLVVEEDDPARREAVREVSAPVSIV